MKQHEADEIKRASAQFSGTAQSVRMFDDVIDRLVEDKPVTQMMLECAKAAAADGRDIDCMELVASCKVLDVLSTPELKESLRQLLARSEGKSMTKVFAELENERSTGT